jgi:glycerol-3-phosphate dehydrogenase
MHRNLSGLSATEFDVVVIGGGICGAAAAWDASQRGLSVALLERGDFGEATSANSLKVVHGGIRYLQHLDLPRVRESSRERSALLRIAPHLVSPMPVLVPAFGHGLQGPGPLQAAFLLLNALTFDRDQGLTQESSVPPARLLSRTEALERCPEIEGPRLTGAGLFWDGQLVNPPRLVWAFARTAAQAGAVLANYCEVREFRLRGPRVAGLTALDRLTNTLIEVRGRVVINATGPFAEQLLYAAGLQRERRIPLSRDLALVIARRPSSSHALALPTKYRDPDAVLSRGPRHLFVVPWHNVTLIGVHSTIYRGDPASLSVGSEQVGLFLDEINEAAPWLALRSKDVAMVYAGLLPAGADALVGTNMSFGKRSHVIDNARSDGVEGLVTAVPNRFTTARGVAARAVDLAARKLGRVVPVSRTAVTPLFGAPEQSVLALTRDIVRTSEVRVDEELAGHMARNHGSNWREVLRLAKDLPLLGQPLGPSPTLGAEVVYATRHEMAMTLGDCVFRRTDIGTAGDPGDAALRRCAELMAKELDWSAAQQECEVADVRRQFPDRAVQPQPSGAAPSSML